MTYSAWIKNLILEKLSGLLYDEACEQEFAMNLETQQTRSFYSTIIKTTRGNNMTKVDARWVQDYSLTEDFLLFFLFPSFSHSAQKQMSNYSSTD